MDVKIIGSGINADVPVQVDPAHKAARVSLRPPDIGIGGSYRMSLISGVIAAGIAGNSPVWEMRWGSNNLVAIVRKLKIQAVASTTAFNATAADSSFSLYRAQGFSAMDGTGATFAAFTVGKTGASSTRYPASAMAGDTSTNRTGAGGIAISNTAAMSAGSKTLDTQAIAKVINRILASAAAETAITPDPSDYMIDPAEAHVLAPIELQASEGLVVMADAITATGTWRLKVDVAWDEVDPARYFGSQN
jgi:hypothetical protein